MIEAKDQAWFGRVNPFEVFERSTLGIDDDNGVLFTGAKLRLSSQPPDSCSEGLFIALLRLCWCCRVTLPGVRQCDAGLPLTASSQNRLDLSRIAPLVARLHPAPVP
jgi:hypothetical protein